MITTPPGFTVAIVEDHRDHRESLFTALSSDAQLEVWAPCRDLRAGLDLLERSCPDVLLVDLGLPGGSGMQLIHSARQRYGTGCTSAVLTVTGNEDHLLGAIGAGAKGYLFKSDDPAEWIETVGMLAHGQSPLQSGLASWFLQCADATQPVHKQVNWPVAYDAETRSILQHISAGYSHVETAKAFQIALPRLRLRLRQAYDRLYRPRAKLTARELDTLRWLNTGCTFKECAREMDVSETTIKTHARNAAEKLMPENDGFNNVQKTLFVARTEGLIA